MTFSIVSLAASVSVNERAATPMQASTRSSRDTLIAEHPSPIGTLWSTWTSTGLFSLNWQPPTTTPSGGLNSTETTRAHELENLLSDYFQGRKVSFRNIEIDPLGWTPFTRQVYQCCREIPIGNTITYKQLAGLAGNEKASRAVGAAMSRNRILLVIPCHRVLSASGSLTGYSAKGGLKTKQLLIDLECQGRLPRDRFASES